MKKTDKPKNKKVRVFSYGTLQDPAIQEYLWGSTPAPHEDVLEGYETYPLYGDILTVRPKDGASVTGKWYAIDRSLLPHTDRYESNMYKREIVQLASGVRAYVYTDNRTA